VSCRVVCISGTDGAEAEEIARIAAERLGFRLIDAEIVARAARRAGIGPDVVADIERRRSFVARLLADLGPAIDIAAAGFAGGTPSSDDALSSDDLRSLVRTAVEATAAEGDVVIVSHAASLALAGREDAVRVLVTASTDTRARRIAGGRAADQKDAVRSVERSDAARADYLKSFYDVRAELPTHYDLVVNTDRLTPSQAAELIVRCGAGVGESHPNIEANR
jgi:cytidylate kinase